jgi:hypothetical protein
MNTRHGYLRFDDMASSLPNKRPLCKVVNDYRWLNGLGKRRLIATSGHAKVRLALKRAK